MGEIFFCHLRMIGGGYSLLQLQYILKVFFEKGLFEPFKVMFFKLRKINT